MESFSQQDLEQALQQCEAEPIHQIGLIQPHGGLLVISADAQRTILQFSENLQEFLDLPDDGAIGKPLRTLVGDETAVDLEQLIQTAKLENFAAAKIQLTVNNALTELQAHVFISGEFFVLELVRDEDAYTGEKLPELLVLIQQVLSSSENEADIYIYFNQIAKVIRELTGFDRVMVYRFDPNWDGEVIAENRKESTASYLG
jgi:light-regulated signal transduction histidine kinase (bacteriophytochrome)